MSECSCAVEGTIDPRCQPRGMCGADNSAKPSPGLWLHAGQCCVCEDRDGKPGRLLFVLRHPHGTSDLISVEELWADTRLCAAAPAMLAALEGVLRVADRKTDEFDAARAAIAKATGAQS
jgi:hypothetical protein